MKRRKAWQKIISCVMAIMLVLGSFTPMQASASNDESPKPRGENTAMGVELIKNGDFTDGTEGWRGHWGGAGALSVLEDTMTVDDEPYTFNYLEVNRSGQNTYWMVRQDVAGDFKKGDMLIYSYKVRSGSASNNRRSRLNVLLADENNNFQEIDNEAEGPYHKKLHSTDPVNDEWVTVTGECEVWEDTKKIQFSFNEQGYNAVGNNIHLADISVRCVVPITGVELDEETLSLVAGTKKELTATVLPAHAANKDVTWSTSDGSVATVVDGEVTAEAVGTATITATSVGDPAKKAECEVTVTAAVVPVESVSLNKSTLSLGVGAKETLTETVLPAEATNKGVEWSTSEATVATVVNGEVTAVAEGTATITATSVGDPAKKAECIVTVNEIPVNSVELNKSTLSLAVGANEKLTATVLPADATNKGVTWSTSEATVAEVVDGEVTAVAVGTATITATSVGDPAKKAECVITVNEAPTGVELIRNGKFTAGVNPWGGHWGGTTGLSVKDDETVGKYLEVDKRGNSWNTYYMVQQEVEGDFKIGDILEYSYKVRSGSTSNNQNTRFNVMIANSSGAFSEDNDAFHKKFAGPRVQGQWVTVTGTCEIWANTKKIRFAYNENSYNAAGNNVHLADVSVLHVVDTTSVPVTGVELDKPALSLTIGAKEELTATVLPDDATRKGVTWSTSNASVVRVDNNGMVTAVAAGTATITATSIGDNTIKAECTVTVNEIPVTDITLNSQALSLEPGVTGTLKATIQPANATNKNVTWSTSSASVATVVDGVVTAVAAGTATITATSVGDPAKKAECTVTVTTEKVAATGVTLDKTELSMVAGTKKTLAETVTPANATNKNVKWSTSNASVAAVDNGVVTAVTAGTVMITATLVTDPAKRAECIVTVTGSILEKTTEANPYLPLWEHLPDGEPRVFEDPDNPGKYRAYIIGSHDLRRNEYCGPDIRAWSAPVEDLTQWRDEGPIFTYNIEDQWDLMYAPDLIEVRRRDENGERTIKEYYLYPHSRGSNRLSMVCKSDSPLGPFTPVNMNAAGTGVVSGSYIGFDPAIYIDYIDDPADPDYEIGFRAYAYWGWMEAEAAELDQNNMWAVRPGKQRIRDFIPCSSDYGIIRKPDIEYPYVAEGEDLESFNYFEAFAMRKVGNKYVLTFSGYSGPDYGMRSTNSALRYAYGDSPLGPWKSGGVLVDSRGPVLDETGSELIGRTWGHNTHGGLQEINDQWYVFYHRPPRGSGNARQAVVAPANIDWDEKPVSEGGKVTIKAYDPYSEDNTWTAKDNQRREYTGMEITSEGFHMYGLDPYKYYSAGIASYVDGGTLQDSYDIWDSHMPIENVRNNARIGYKYFGFGGLDENKKGLKAFEGTKPGNNTKFNVFLTPITTAGFKVSVWLDGPWDNDTWNGTKIGEIIVPAGSAQETQRFQIDVSDAVDNLDGKHAVFLVAEGSGTGNLFNLIGLGFSSEEKEIERPIMPEISIRINGNEMELPAWPLASTAKNGIVGYDMYEVDPPTGLTSVPDIEASASDKSVKVTVSKPTSLSGIAYVRFEKDGKAKTYRIPFANQQYNVSDELHLGVTSVELAAGIIGDVLVLNNADTLTDEQKAQKAKEKIDDMLQEALLENELISGVNADVTYTNGSFVLKLTSGNTEMINSAFSIRNPVTVEPVTGVTLDKATLSLSAGTKGTLKATTAPDNATIKEVMWSTSDESVATVDNGVVTAVAPGEVTITATSFSDNTKKAECVVTVTPKSGTVDKTALNAKITEAEGKTESEYTQASWSAMQTALTAAKTVSDNASATQAQVDGAQTALTTAINELELKPIIVNKTALNAKIEEAENTTASAYTDASWSAMQTALTAAKLVSDNVSATQAQVDGALTALTTAINGLELKPVMVDKAALNAKITEAEGKTESAYTQASWSAMQTALTAAKTVSNNANATQAQVDGATAALTKAINGLVSKPAVPAVNSRHTVGKLVYKVLKSHEKNGTVQVIGMSKKTHTTITIPNTVTLKGYVFKVTEVGNKAFANSTKLRKVTIKDNVTKIRTKAFYNCKKLTTLKVGKGLTSIGKEAFSKCKILKKITINSSKIKTVGKNAFKEISGKAKIKVPKKQVSKYKGIFKKDGRPKGVKIVKIK